jgi:hypothetical protein
MQQKTETCMLHATQHLDPLSHILTANSELTHITVQHNTKLSQG